MTDDDGIMGTDDTLLECLGNEPPIADAGPDQSVTDTDLSGAEEVQLSGS